MDVNIINPFIRSTKQIFADMVHISLSAGKPYLKPPAERVHKLYQLSAIIGFSGSMQGQVILSMSEPVCLAISSALLAMPIHKVNAECYDAIAELINMIAGGAKKDIAPSTPISLTIPKIMLSENVRYLRDLPVLIIPFDTSVGKMLLQVLMHKHQAAEPEFEFLSPDENEAA